MLQLYFAIYYDGFANFTLLVSGFSLISVFQVDFVVTGTLICL